MPLTAGQVTLPRDLSDVFGGIGTGAYNQIGQNYGGALAKSAGDASAQGFAGGPTDYTKQRLAATQGLDIGNLEAGLGSGLGNAAYKNQLGQRDYTQQSQLANIIGGAMAPSTLQEIFQGIGGGAKALTPWLGMMGGSSNKIPGMAYANTPSPLSVMPTDPSGFENYGYGGYGGGF
jgi:hypothetical protein